ncbi:spore germination protein [Paenibacillus ferrarius]|uniref:spore germination protein n=1 Tax=Paenibacillus ferrarius TaxID=1469647 RepID=UPI0009A4A72C|nr:spore germination protein [Paenibacillus ferrarius]
MRLFNKGWKRYLKTSDATSVSEVGIQIQHSSLLDDNLLYLTSLYEECGDIVFHSFVLANGIKAAVVYAQGLADEDLFQHQILEPLQHIELGKTEFLSQLVEQLTAKAEQLTEWSTVIERIGSGHPILWIDGSSAAFAFGMTKITQRTVEEPVAESTIRGPREGFTESIGVNIPLIRRRIKSPELKMINMTIGTYTKTQITLAYMKNLADPHLVAEMKLRIERIRIHGVLESEMIEEWISDNPYSPFPQVLPTERPDVVCANVLEGRLAVLIDGTPFVLIAPVGLFSLLQSAEDYYQNVIMSTFIRLLRYVFFIISVLLPSAYVAITTFHQEMIPSVLLLNISKSREEIPFPALVEALIMETTFEALREAGVRLPKQVGAAVSIVGALVIGQAATSAGIVSAPMVIVVAITGIASFMIPRYTLGIPLRLIRFPIMLMAGTLGLVGVILGFIGIILHLCRLSSLGVPYLTPISPTRFKEFKDLLFRAPVWKQEHHPQLSGYQEQQNETIGLHDKGEDTT